jgi:N-methylhydantoinase B
MTVDPVTFEVVSGGLRALAQEMKVSVMRTAYSPIVASGGDMSAGIADSQGRVVAQGQDIPAQLGALPGSLEAMLAGWHGKLEPGDVLIGNDPYLCGSNHINDVCLVMPMFVNDELLAYACTRTHWMDIGGGTPGSFNAQVADMYAEGLRIPTVLAYRKYEPVEPIWEIIFANVRGRKEREWDLRAGFSGCATAERGLQRICGRYGMDVVRSVMEMALIDSERRMRARLESIEDGTFRAVDWMEGDGWEDRPVRLEVAITIAGDSIRMDWAGSDPQIRGGLNLPYSSTFGVGIYALKAALGQGIAPNAGLWAPLEVVAPEGTVVNPRPPAPTQASAAETIQRSADLLMMCLAQVVPADVMAGTFASASVLMVEGRDPIEWRRNLLGRDRAVFMDNGPGGMGGRRTADGVSGIKVHTGNARVPSIEAAEFAMPIRAVRWERIPDTGGPGNRRGGCGVAKEWEVLDDHVNFTQMTERARIPAFGLLGGRAGALGRFVINPGQPNEQRLASKTPPRELNRGDHYLFQSAGGGGYGDPHLRAPEAVLEDVRESYVSRAAAQDVYGVVIDDESELDVEATEALRQGQSTPAAVGLIDRGSWKYDGVDSSDAR